MYVGVDCVISSVVCFCFLTDNFGSTRDNEESANISWCLCAWGNCVCCNMYMHFHLSLSLSFFLSLFPSLPSSLSPSSLFAHSATSSLYVVIYTANTMIFSTSSTLTAFLQWTILMYPNDHSPHYIPTTVLYKLHFHSSVPHSHSCFYTLVTFWFQSLTVKHCASYLMVILWTEAHFPWRWYWHCWGSKFSIQTTSTCQEVCWTVW